MNKKIIVSFPAEMVKEQRNQITEQVNNTLAKINSEVANWNGFVDFAKTGSGDLRLIAKCDNDEIREKMQELINTDMEIFSY